MSVTLDRRVVPPGEDDYLQAAWELKEAIREEEGLLKQRWGFFADAYRKATVHAFFDGETLAGFAAARGDGYILFLGIDPDYRGRGLGERLIAAIAEDATGVSCHARVSNRNALEFYEHLGFERVRRIQDYYEDGVDAYYLRLGDSDRLLERLTELFGR
ncbi:GNAT family N-acetyltransferase [Halodesulfurarchaeum formicicum]|uniref:GNAT family N-acetyltransferase n=1 Tax=Halodesulfurarchaeum formicicum TaxID=1873524 RepID=UPI00090319D0|nr:N-acetyltransferase [Halodesulfurarchaeum formicicum]